MAKYNKELFGKYVIFGNVVLFPLLSVKIYEFFKNERKFDFTKHFENKGKLIVDPGLDYPYSQIPPKNWRKNHTIPVKAPV